uniref:Uncharacterized protein n=1 Tax=Arundo donax TaxID=35708 RepID=A0A0A9EAV5_ARUDO
MSRKISEICGKKCGPRELAALVFVCKMLRTDLITSWFFRISMLWLACPIISAHFWLGRLINLLRYSSLLALSDSA